MTREGYNLVVDGLREWTLLTLNTAVSSTKIREEKDVSHVDTKIEKSVKKTLKDQS